MSEFKIGDKVTISKEKVLQSCKYLPNWYTTKIFTIVEITGVFDIYDYPIVDIGEDFSDNGSTITTFYLDFAIKHVRKEKLERLIKISIITS
jgi:hypothetical protein